VSCHCDAIVTRGSSHGSQPANTEPHFTDRPTALLHCIYYLYHTHRLSIALCLQWYNWLTSVHNDINVTPAGGWTDTRITTDVE